jgi:hypothetical protein
LRGDDGPAAFGSAPPAPETTVLDGSPQEGDFALEHAYVILDAGHTYKLRALGSLAAADILEGSEPRLAPFRLNRFATGALQPSSQSPYPWI